MDASDREELYFVHQEHVAIPKSGVAGWSLRRVANRGVRPTLVRVNLSEANVSVCNDSVCNDSVCNDRPCSVAKAL